MARQRQGSRHIPFLALLLLVTAAVRCQPTEDKPLEGPGGEGTVSYVNEQYGFRFDLPDDWRGFCVIRDQWKVGSEENGPLILLRNPEYTRDDPHEDIPIWVYTRKQWKRIMRRELLVSPVFPPTEMGHNARYVFAILPRYFNDDRTGYKEVLTIVLGHPIQTFRPKTHGEQTSRRAVKRYNPRSEQAQK